MGADDAGTLARLAGIAHAMCDVSDELVADFGHICDASGVGVVINVPLSPPASRIIAEDPDLVPRLAGVGDDCELVFTSPTDASPAIECLSPELALPITATGAIVRKAGVRLVDAARQRVPITAAGWQHFWC
jgi:thiamine-monophosphate kinase